MSMNVKRDLILGLLAVLLIIFLLATISVPRSGPEKFLPGTPPSPTQSGASSGLAELASGTSRTELTVPPRPMLTGGLRGLMVASVSTPPAVMGGIATWYRGPEGHASVPWGYWHMRRQPVRVCLQSNTQRCVNVVLVGYCGCFQNTDHPRLIDLSRADFAKLGNPGRGWLAVEVIFR